MDEKRKVVKQGYDVCAVDYSETRDLFKNQKYLEDLARELPVGAKVLDLGCGAGIPIDKFLLEKGYRVTGMDISSEQLNLAKQNLPDGEFIQSDMSEVNFPEDSFDAIVSFYAIFHIPREEHEDLLKKCFALLKKDGHLLVTMGASEWEGTENDFHGAKMFWSHYGKEKNIEMVKRAGFEIVYEVVDESGGEKHLVIFARKK